MPKSKTISVGHGSTESGCGVVLIRFDNVDVALSVEGARLVAEQILNWARHAEIWKQTDEEKRQQIWAKRYSGEIETEIYNIRNIRC